MSRPCMSKPLLEHAVKRSKSILCRVGRSLGLAAALVATGLSAAAVAQPMAAVAERGDLALVPYYTVRGQWVTGIHIVNTSAMTQVVKFRFRRATDAMDALDFNVVMSPNDVYAGFLSDNENGAISWTSPDTTCTAPTTQDKRLTMPPIYRAGAESGYVEIIAMGQPINEQQPIAAAARHSATTSKPADCAAVRSNFFADGSLPAGTTAGVRGVVNNVTTFQPGVASASDTTIKDGGPNTYTDSGNVLKVSYFIRDNSTGIEFGDNAVHIADFLGLPSITNQEYGIGSGDLNGFDFPDLDGTGLPNGAAADTVARDRFNLLRRTDMLGMKSIINEWSANPANGVQMDWVVTLPGQYTMLRLPQYLKSLGADRAWVSTVSSAGRPLQNPQCPRTASGTGESRVSACDFRDLPLELEYVAYNREEFFKGEVATGTLVVSPQPPTVIAKTYLPKVANVITFGGNSVLGQSDANVNASLGQPFGWLEAQLKSQSNPHVCEWVSTQDGASSSTRPLGTTAGQALTMDCASAAMGSKVPVIGFAAWSRQVAANPDASYGRVVEHSYGRDRASTAMAPGTVFRDALKDGGQGPQMVVLPTGSFQMGTPSGGNSDERPVRTVTISKRIAMGRYEVTFDDYDRFADADSSRSRPNAEGWGRGTRPVINVTRADAKAYAAWLSTQTGKTYRLPSEAEWEYAARAGTTTRYSWGDEIGNNRANCRGCKGSVSVDRTDAVGSFAANPFGLFDMHGNVWEWVEDCHGSYASAPSDGSARTSGSGCRADAAALSLGRGGSWWNNQNSVRSATRSSCSPSVCPNFSTTHGLRLVRDLNP